MFIVFLCLKRAKMNPSADPADPGDPPDPADPVHGLPLGTSRPHAPGVRMTVVIKTNSLKKSKAASTNAVITCCAKRWNHMSTPALKLHDFALRWDFARPHCHSCD